MIVVLAISTVGWALVVLAVAGGILLLWSAAMVVTGRLTLDVGIGRSFHALGPITVRIGAPRDIVFEVVSAPYFGRVPRDARGSVEVLERGADMVVAAHHTRLRFFTSTTVEAVRFEPPGRITFRLLRGPVPHVEEEFVLRDDGGSTEFRYEGRLAADFWVLGRIVGRFVAAPTWTSVVRRHLEDVKRAAEERAEAARRRRG